MKSLGLESVSRLIIWRLPALVPAGARAGVRPFVRCNSCTLTNIVVGILSYTMTCLL
jgi:hypothetical protein